MAAVAYATLSARPLPLNTARRELYTTRRRDELGFTPSGDYTQSRMDHPSSSRPTPAPPTRRDTTSRKQITIPVLSPTLEFHRSPQSPTYPSPSQPPQSGQTKSKSGGLKAFFGGGGEKRSRTPSFGTKPSTGARDGGGKVMMDAMGNVRGVGGRGTNGNATQGAMGTAQPVPVGANESRRASGNVGDQRTYRDPGSTVIPRDRPTSGPSTSQCRPQSPPGGVAFPFPSVRHSGQPARPSEPTGLPPVNGKRRNKPSLSGFLRTVKGGATTQVTKLGSPPTPVKPESVIIPVAAMRHPPTIARRTSSRLPDRTPAPQITGSRASRQDAIGGTMHIPPSISGTITKALSSELASHRVSSPAAIGSSSPLALSRTTSVGSTDSAGANEDHYTLRIACTFIVRTLLPQVRALGKQRSAVAGSRRRSESGSSTTSAWYEAEAIRTQIEHDLLPMERMERAWGIEWMLRRAGTDAPVWAERTKHRELETFEAGVSDGLVLCFLLSQITSRGQDIQVSATLQNAQRNLDTFILGSKISKVTEVAGLPKGYFSTMAPAKTYLMAKIVVALARLSGPNQAQGTTPPPKSPRSEDGSALTDVEESPGPSKPALRLEDAAKESQTLCMPEGIPAQGAGGSTSTIAWASYQNLSEGHLPAPILGAGKDVSSARVSFSYERRRDLTPSLVTGSSATPRTSTAFTDATFAAQVDLNPARPTSPFANSGSRSPRHVRPLAKRRVSLGSAAPSKDEASADMIPGLGSPKLRPRPSVSGQTKVYAPKQPMSRRDSGHSAKPDVDTKAESPPGTPIFRRDSSSLAKPSMSSRRSSYTTPEKARQRQSISIEEEGKPSTTYTLGNFIGKGQFGEVYRAMGKHSGDFVAVKRIDIKGLAEREVKDILNEVELLKGLSHPAVVKYYGMRRDDAVVDIVLEYVDGGSLLSTLKAFGQFSEQVAASYTARILDGIIYLHGEGVIHCDLKCANILITSKGNIKITDFGISLNNNAPRLDQLKNNVAGSPNWMAPEVIELKGPATASDIWASGCTVIEMLTGFPPHGDIQNNMAVMFRIVEDAMPPSPPDISHQCESFLQDCFRREVQDRPSARALFAHPWIQNHLVLEPGNSRNVDASIPFIKRISRDWNEGSPVLKHAASKRTSLNTYFMGQSSASVHRHERSSSTSQEVVPKAEHAFVQIKFSTAIACRLCALPLRTDAVFCQECGLVCHATCARNRGDACEAKTRSVIEAMSRRQTNYSEDAVVGSIRAKIDFRIASGNREASGPTRDSGDSDPDRDPEEQRRLALLQLTSREQPHDAVVQKADGDAASNAKDKFTPLPALLSHTKGRKGSRPLSDQTQTRLAGTHTRAALRPFSSTPVTQVQKDHDIQGIDAAHKVEGRDCVLM